MPDKNRPAKRHSKRQPTVKFLQINKNRSRGALDLAVETGRKIGASLVLISEPNKLAIKHRKDWISDGELDTAIYVLDRQLRIKDQGYGPGFSYVATPELTVYSCYCSGNKDIEDLERTLDTISNRIVLSKENTVITGDFNAKSPMWASTHSDARGHLMMDWIAENNLIVANEGTQPTFQRPNCESILDLTILSESLGAKVEQWAVSAEESLSDHNYISFDINENPVNVPQIRQKTRGWQIRKLDRQKLGEAIMATEEKQLTAEEFSNLLRQMSNKTMPKMSGIRGRRPVYWWSAEIESLISRCVRARRDCTRRAKKEHASKHGECWQIYLARRKTLRIAIKRAKRLCWKQVCEEVDKDIWGKGYQIVMKGIMGFPPRLTLPLTLTEAAVEHLFPIHEEVSFQCVGHKGFEPFTERELTVACGRLKNKKAPGPGKIHAEILKKLAAERPSLVLKLYNNLANKACFPDLWKRATLLLLKKGDKPANSPSSYRPLSLLDVEGKLYEQLLVARLKAELKKNGDLSDRQYGFRQGRQTVDAVRRVLSLADEAGNYASRNRRICAVVTIDVRNAFNSIPREAILDSIRKRQISEGLIAVTRSYLSEREIEIEAEGITTARETNSGVPQGSVVVCHGAYKVRQR